MGRGELTEHLGHAGTRPATTHTTHWCSAVDGEHTFRTDWVISGGATITGPTVQLLKR